MKIVFVSDYLNFHQTALCDCLHSISDTFYFISGYSGEGQKSYKGKVERDYVIYYSKEPARAKEEIMSADAVIFGACPSGLVKMRMKENKLSFVFSERVFKKSVLQFLKPENKKIISNRFLDFKDKNFYVLAASAFLPYDLSLYNFPSEKIFKWGYFPETIKTDKTEKIDNSILFAGRFLDWKHTDTVIETAKLLQKDKMKFRVSIVGAGPEKEKLHALVNKYNLSDCVEFLGLKNHDEVLKLMSLHQIFMFTSSFKEGWGAVLNEAMSNGCAIVASSAAGSTPYLVNHNENGMIYEYGNYKNAYKAVKELLNDKEKTEKLGNNAKITIENEYSSEIAAERFVNAVKEFYSNGSITPQKSGVLSGVEILKNNWFKS